MASEYLKWKYRDVKPDKPIELTPKEKRANWWHYHKWHVVLGAVGIVIIADIAIGIFKEKTDVPDYQIAYVGTESLPEDTVAQLEQLFSGLGEDLDGDGEVTVRINQYASHTEDDDSETESAISVVSDSADNANYATAAQVTLMADMESCDSFFFLLEDPVQFEKDYEILSYVDGSLPGQYMTDYENCYLAYSDSSLLMSQKLGTYQETVAGETVTGSSDDIVDGLYIARRGFWSNDTCSNLEGCEALWNKITGLE